MCKKKKIKYSVENVGSLGRCLVVHLVDFDEAEFQVFFKLKTYKYSLIYLLLFIIFFYFDIKILNLSGEMLLYNANIAIIVSILREYMYNRLYLILPIILFIYSYLYYKSKNWKEYKMIVLRSLYRLLNLLINISIVISLLGIGWYDYIEYNIIFFVMVLISCFLLIYKLIILRKIDDDSFIQHFLSFPYITLSYFIILFFYNSKLIFKWYTKILSYDNKYYLCTYKTKEELDLEKFLKLEKLWIEWRKIKGNEDAKLFEKE